MIEGHEAVVDSSPRAGVLEAVEFFSDPDAGAGPSRLELVLASRRGDTRAFARLVILDSPKVRSRLLRLGSRYADREDMTQEVFIRMWRSIQALRDPQAYGAWLNRIISRVALDAARHRDRHIEAYPASDRLAARRQPSGEGGGLEIVDTAGMPEEVLLRAELMSRLCESVLRLSPAFKLPLLLREMEGLSYKEIVDRTGLELGTVKSRISRARARVAADLASYLATPR